MVFKTAPPGGGKAVNTLLGAIVQYSPAVKDVCAVMYSAAHRGRVWDIPLTTASVTEVFSTPCSSSKADPLLGKAVAALEIHFNRRHADEGAIKSRLRKRKSVDLTVKPEVAAKLIQSTKLQKPKKIVDGIALSGKLEQELRTERKIRERLEQRLEMLEKSNQEFKTKLKRQGRVLEAEKNQVATLNSKGNSECTRCRELTEHVTQLKTDLEHSKRSNIGLKLLVQSQQQFQISLSTEVVGMCD